MKLTIFTPTYNRAHLLPQLYNSLCKQLYSDFEWLIIDDDSSDNTEELVNSWKTNSKFEINYYKQKHGGKHRALNKGFNLAKGEYFFIVDSDDYITDDAVSKIYMWIEDTSPILNLAGFSGLKSTHAGVVGGNIKTGNKTYVDASYFERGKYNLYGDKAEVYRLSVLKQHPFPEFENEYFVTEAVCWDSIAHSGLKLRWYNETIYMCEYLDDGLSKTGANSISGHIKNYKGYCYYISKLIQYHGFFSNPRLLNEYVKTADELNKKSSDIAKDLNITTAQAKLFKICIFFGFIKSGLKKVFKM